MEIYLQRCFYVFFKIVWLFNKIWLEKLEMGTLDVWLKHWSMISQHKSSFIWFGCTFLFLCWKFLSDWFCFRSAFRIYILDFKELSDAMSQISRRNFPILPWNIYVTFALKMSRQNGDCQKLQCDVVNWKFLEV